MLGQQELKEIEKIVAEKAKEAAVKQVNGEMLKWMIMLMGIGSILFTILISVVMSNFNNMYDEQQKQIDKLTNLTDELNVSVIRLGVIGEKIFNSNNVSQFKINNKDR